MRGSEWKLVLAFVVGAVLSFLIGMYVLGPIFVSHRENEVTKVREGTTETNPVPTIADSVPNTIYRRDVNSIPDATAVIVEAVPRPMSDETEPEPSFEPQQEQPEPQLPRQTRKPLTQPRRSLPEGVEPSVSEPISPPTTTINPPQPPEKLLPPPPSAEARRNYRVRLGVFTREENVKRMMETLVNQGYQPYTEEEIVGGQKRYRIYVGAFDNQESAEKLKQELAEKGFPGIVDEKQE
ncbi:MAG: SPOR domain-containing protein [Armatimonadetes bacterium]|nr:SPOR domain-containing protein [Armatimonadota bacterium]